jgi:hypothetical protein
VECPRERKSIVDLEKLGLVGGGYGEDPATGTEFFKNPDHCGFPRMGNETLKRDWERTIQTIWHRDWACDGNGHEGEKSDECELHVCGVGFRIDDLERGYLLRVVRRQAD